MTLLVRDEADIIRTNIEFHLAQGVDAVIAIDNGSRDGTREILDDYARANVAVVFDEPGRDYAQSTWVTRAALHARDEMGADWIINSDADEFWAAPGTTLKQVARTAKAPQLICTRRNMLCAHEELNGGKSPAELVYRVARNVPLAPLADIYVDPLPAPYFYLNLPPKVMVQAAGLMRVKQGNHSALFEGSDSAQNCAIEVFHFPVRSRTQFERKIVQGGHAYLANKEFPENTGWHWRRWHRAYYEHGLGAPLADALPSRQRLDQDLRAGLVLEDQRFRDLVGETGRGHQR